MKLLHVVIAGTALASASAFAQSQSQSPNPPGSASQRQESSSSGSSSAQSQSPEVVKQAQEKLSAAGHDAGPADGKLGPKTRQALMEFQRSKGLSPSGQLDSQTMAALQVDESSGSSSTGGSSGSSGSSSDSSSTGSGSSK